MCQRRVEVSHPPGVCAPPSVLRLGALFKELHEALLLVSVARLFTVLSLTRHLPLSLLCLCLMGPHRLHLLSICTLIFLVLSSSPLMCLYVFIVSPNIMCPIYSLIYNILVLGILYTKYT